MTKAVESSLDEAKKHGWNGRFDRAIRSESPHSSRAARRRRASPPLAFVGDAMDATDAMGETVKIRWRARKDVAT